MRDIMLRQKIGKINSAKMLPTWKHKLDIQYEPNIISNNYTIKRFKRNDDKISDMSLLNDSYKYNKGHIIESKKNTIFKLLNERDVGRYKCRSCSSCCIKYRQTHKKKYRISHGEGRYKIGRVSHIGSSTFATLSKSEPQTSITVHSSGQFKGDCETKINIEKQSKSEIYDFQNNRYDELNCRKSSKLPCAATSDGNMLKNTRAILNFGTKNLSNQDLLRRCPFYHSPLYAMNLRVEYDKKSKFKLEPYECEPGVCIPGQCDPIECEKLIRKRLMKKPSTMTTTELQTLSMSNEGREHVRTRSPGQENRRLREEPKAIFKPRGLRYQTIPRQKRAVRIGSNFSFSLEFSKNKSRRNVKNKSRSRKKANVSPLGGTTIDKQLKAHHILKQDGKTQSISNTKEKGSMMKLKHKRCFCTLELHSKELQHKAINATMKNTLPDNAVTMSNIGQNTKKVDFLDDHHLEPHECEPNFCIPGECNPYQCLERIKIRNRGLTDLVTGMDYKNASLPSMSRPKKGKQRKKKIRAVKRNPENQKPVHTPVSNNPSRQAVRIESSFSFNVEFVKNKSLDPQDSSKSPKKSNKQSHKKSKKRNRTKKTNAKPKKLPQQDINDPDFHANNRKPAKIQDSRRKCLSFVNRIAQKILNCLRENSKICQKCFKKCSKKSPNTNNETPLVSQSNHNKQAVSISSNFSFNIEFFKDRSLPPSYDTQKLKSNENSEKKAQHLMLHKQKGNKNITSGPQDNNQGEFEIPMTGSKASGNDNSTKRCFCTLKLQNVGTQERGKMILNPENTLIDTYVEAKMKYGGPKYRETGTKARKQLTIIEPYECEPGTCIPGLCNPEDCYERIKKRNLQMLGIENEYSGIKSETHVTGIRDSHKRKKPTPLDDAGKTKTKQIQPQRIVEVPRIDPSRWQGVKIGSNFSFHIDFFKEFKTPSGGTEKDENQLQVNDENVIADDKAKIISQKHTHGRALADNAIQVQKSTENKASFAGKALKRCFCTAKFFQE